MEGRYLYNATVMIPRNASVHVTTTLRYTFASRAFIVTEGVPYTNSTVNISIADPAYGGHDIHVMVRAFSSESNYSNNHANRKVLPQETTYLALMSLGTEPGISLSDGGVVPLNFDILLLLSLQAPQLIGLQNNIGLLDEEGRGQASWFIPKLNGITVYVAFVVIDNALPVPFVSISNAVPIMITQ